MELCINGNFTTDPSADDIGRAFSAPHPKGWYLVLDNEDALAGGGREISQEFFFHRVIFTGFELELVTFTLMS